MSWRSKAVEGLVLLVAMAVVARVVFGLLGPLLPSILVLLALCGTFRLLFKRHER